MKQIMLLIFSVFVLAGTGCNANPADSDQAGGEDPLTPIRLPMGFIPDPQYAPFYVAREKGFYAAEGLSVTFDYSSETDGLQLVGAGELPFAIVSGEQVLLGRAQDLPLVYVLEWFQRYPIVVVSPAEAGLETPQDLAGHTVGLPGFYGASYVGYVGLLSAAGVSAEAVREEEIGFTQVETLLTERVDAVVGYANNEPVQLRARGETVNVIYVADYVDMVANGIVTNEMTIAENPQLVSGFVRATLRGLSDTLADPAAAYEISKQYVEGLDNSRMNVLEASLPIWEAETLGYTDPESWRQTQAILIEAGLLDEPLSDLAALYSNRFVLEGQPGD